MRAAVFTTALLLCSCADEPGIVLCLDADRFADGDSIALRVTFASAPAGPPCRAIDRVVGRVPYCVAATPGQRYGYAMALQAVWSHGDAEVGRREVVVPFDPDRLIEGDVLLGRCCNPGDGENECRDGACVPTGSSTFFDDQDDPEDCEDQ